MSPSYRSIKAALSRELAEYRSVVEINRDILEKNSLLGRQLVFWTKSAQYYIVQLEVWQKNEDMQRYEEALKSARENLDHVSELVIQLTEAAHGKDDE